RRVRRVSAADRGEAFLGTDFSYEDINNETRLHADDYTYRVLDPADWEGRPCVKLEAVPVDDRIARELGYGRAVLWVDSEIWMPRRIEIWDVAGNPLKEVVFTDIAVVQGIWTAQRVEARDLKSGHRTTFTFTEVDYQRDIADQVFSEHLLGRGPVR